MNTQNHKQRLSPAALAALAEQKQKQQESKTRFRNMILGTLLALFLLLVIAPGIVPPLFSVLKSTLWGLPKSDYARNSFWIDQEQVLDLYRGIHPVYTTDAMGSGIVFEYHRNLFVLTANHVDSHMTGDMFLLHQGKVVPLKVVRRYPSYDLLLLHLMSFYDVEHTTSFEFGPTPDEMNFFIYYMGYGGDGHPKLIGAQISEPDADVILTDENAFIIVANDIFMPGNSGGPVFALDLRDDMLKCVGLVVGMNTLVQNIGVATTIPPSLIRDMDVFLLTHPFRNYF
ncbi:MAG: trypsin-like peptidase domain-containing protein [Deltaproteobacteria bacterium]|nr:trypsin-like peptidase domain-containing protein [Candidatus Zymogenaceae bacterium]